MKQGSELVITINDDGTLSMDGSKMIGTDAELMATLKALAKAAGDGEVVVEKHTHKHSHGHSHDHHHHTKG